MLGDFFNYANYINAQLTKEYVDRAKDELKIIETRFTDMSSTDTNIVETVLSIDRYVVAAETGAKVFVIQNPTRPARVSPGASLVFSMCVLAGGMLGSVFVLIRNAVRNRKQALAAS